MGMVYSYVKAWWGGICRPLQEFTTHYPWPLDELAGMVGSKHGRWIGRWLHGVPTKAMIYKVFVLIGGVLIGTGFVCISQYYRPITGLLIGTLGLLMFAIWGVSDEDVK